MSIGSEVKKHNSMLKRAFLVLAVFTMAATVCLTVIFVLPGIKGPVSLLKFPRTRYIVLSFVLFALWTGAVILLVALETRVMRQKSRGLIVLAGVINGLALLGLLFSLILSAAGFPGKVGTITISNAEELSYIRNYPGGDYVLAQDIDMGGQEWKSVPQYTGTLDGNGHSILHITIGKNGFIEENLGEISSVTLSDVRYAEFKPGREFGTLVKVNRGSVVSCGVSPADVDANPAANVLVGCNYGTCKKNAGICHDRCEEHTYVLVSSAPAAFFRPGAGSYLCQVCGDAYTSVAVYRQPLKLIVSIVLLLAAVAGIILTASSDADHKSAGITFFGIAALFMAFVVFSYQTVGVSAGKGETWIDRWLADEERLEANQPGVGEGEDENSDGDMRPDEAGTKFDWAALEPYLEEPAQVVEESEKNNSFQSATHIDTLSTVVGNLSSEKDVDFYSYTVTVKSNVTFQFSHQGKVNYTHWDACLYGSDKTTVLNEGHIASAETSEFGLSDLDPGTYYLKISNAVGGNPLLNVFSDALYAITFVPTCVEHPACTQYVYTRPTCTEPGEIISICDECKTTVSLDEIEPEGHTWGEWKTTREATWLQTGEWTRTCPACGETESEKILTFAWVMPSMVLALAVMIAGLIFFLVNLKRSARYRLYVSAVIIALALFLCAVIGGYGLIQTPLGLSAVQVNLALAAFCSVNFLLITGVVSTMFDGGTRCTAAIVISVFGMAFLFLARTLLVEKYALALAILFGVMALLSLILACVVYLNYRRSWRYRWAAFAVAAAVLASGLAIAFGMEAEKQGGAAPASGMTQVQKVPEKTPDR